MEKKKDWRIARGVINQMFDYLIENGIEISVEFRQKHNDRLADYVADVYDKELDRAREEGIFTREELQEIKRWREIVDEEFGKDEDCFALEEKISNLLVEDMGWEEN